MFLKILDVWQWNPLPRQLSKSVWIGLNRLSCLADGFYALYSWIKFKICSEPLKHTLYPVKVLLMALRLYSNSSQHCDELFIDRYKKKHKQCKTILEIGDGTQKVSKVFQLSSLWGSWKYCQSFEWHNLEKDVNFTNVLTLFFLLHFLCSFVITAGIENASLVYSFRKWISYLK